MQPLKMLKSTSFSYKLHDGFFSELYGQISMFNYKKIMNVLSKMQLVMPKKNSIWWCFCKLPFEYANVCICTQKLLQAQSGRKNISNYIAGSAVLLCNQKVHELTQLKANTFGVRPRKFYSWSQTWLLIKKYSNLFKLEMMEPDKDNTFFASTRINQSISRNL